MFSISLVAFALSAPIPVDPSLPEEAKVLVEQLNQPTAKTRLEAIHKLRLLARRAEIRGGQRTRRGEEFSPKVPGLVPYLIRAVNDEAEPNRIGVLYALADTLDPAAVPAIRERLKDKSESVRFTAACLLTEFKDASGLDELKAALPRLRANKQANGPFQVELLLASFQRITGKRFGEIPMNWLLLSDSRKAAESEARSRELLDTWATWWDWKPAK